MRSWLRASKTKRSLAERAELILLCSQGFTATQVSEKLSKRLRTVQEWRRRYLQQGLSGLEDQPRSGRPRKFSPAKVRAILTATVQRIPCESTFWSVRLMAEHAGVSCHQVTQIWKAADLKPHRIRNFKISHDPHFAEKVIDVVGLYMDPPDNALVLSVDEKTQIQALDRTQPMLQLKPGQIERRTHDYKRHGTASLYAAFDVATGEVMGRITKRHRAQEFLAFLRQIDQAVDPDLDIHLILDNSSTHKTEKVRSWLAPPRMLPPALYSYQRLLAQRRGDLVLSAGASFHLPQLLHQRSRSATGDPKIHASPQSTLGQALQVARHRRFDPGKGQKSQRINRSMLTSGIYQTAH